VSILHKKNEIGKKKEVAQLLPSKNIDFSFLRNKVVLVKFYFKNANY